MSGQQYQLRGDTRSNLASVTPAAKEVFVVTDKKGEMGVGNGSSLANDNQMLFKRKGHHESLSPAQITANQNDYNPSGLAYAETLYLNTDAARNITGIAGGDTDRFLHVINNGSFNFTLVDASASSSAANRFSFGRDVVMRPKQAVGLVYSAASSRWFLLADAFMWASVTDLPENLTLSGISTPAQITANQNDYAISATASVLRLSTDASRNITGFAGGASGRVVKAINVNTNPIVLQNANTNSTAANRFDIGADVTLAAKQSISLWYDTADSRWKMFGNTAGAAVADGAVTAVKLAGAALASGVAMVNGTIVESHAASAVTFAIKTLAGTDPSASDPTLFVFPTATGGYAVRTVTAALSLVVSSGSSLGATNGVPFKLWLVAFDDAGTVRLGVINCWSGTRLYPLNDGLVASSTAEGGAGAADNAGTFYTGTAVTAKPYRIIGFAEYQSGLAAAGTWIVTPDAVRLFGPGVRKPGDVVALQAMSTTTQTDMTSNAFADTNVTLSTSLTSPCNVNLIAWAGDVAVTDAGNYIVAHCHRGGSPVGSPSVSVLGLGGPIGRSFLDAPGTTASTTYKVRIRSGTNTKNVSFPYTSSDNDLGTMQVTELST
jgi:hypothetical protein